MISPQHPKTQMRYMGVFGVVAFLVWISSVLGLLVRLGSMNLAGLAPLALGSIALGIAYTSLLYGRARAVEDGPVRRRTLIAAEKAFRAVVLHMITLVVGTLIYVELGRHGYVARVPTWTDSGLSFGLEPVPMGWTYAFAKQCR